MTSRLTFGMARDGLLPARLSRLLPTRRTPGLAIAVTTALSMVLALTGEVDVLASTLVLLLLIVFVSVNAAVLVLRQRPQDDAAPGSRAWTDHFRAPSIVRCSASCRASCWRRRSRPPSGRAAAS